MTIICIGDGGYEAHLAAQTIANNRKLEYYGVLDANTVIRNGVYHTSINDISPQQLLNTIQQDTEIIKLDNANNKLLSVCKQTPISQYLEQNTSFCALAWTSRHYYEKGVKLCCFQNDFVEDIDTIKTKMLAAQPVDSCKCCTLAEQEGRASQRIIQTNQVADFLGVETVSDITDISNPVLYDIAVGNQCNAMCRMCSPGNSHLIDKEYSKLGIGKKLGIVSSTSFNVIDIKTVKKVYVTGGEPTIVTDFLKFLEDCIEQNRTDFYLQINTNASVLSSKFIKLIKNFNNVQFVVSVDGWKETLYYIRYPITWDKLINNVLKLSQLGDVCFNHTISIYNVGHMYNLIKYFNELFAEKTTLINFVDSPNHMWFGNHPNKIRVLQEVEKCRKLPSYKNDINFCRNIDHIEHTIKTHTLDENLLDEFYKFNNMLDISRNLKLSDYIPELVKENIV